MPRSSRSKSHKKSKHSSRDYSDLDEDVKSKERHDNNDGKENGGSIKISKDSLLSGEKRKAGKDLSSVHANEDVSEYATPTKRRKEKTHGGSERWNGDGVEEKGEVVNVDDKKLKLKSKDSLKVVCESKSKTSRKHEVDSANFVVSEKEENRSGSGNRSEKKSDKESARKEGRQVKETKDRGSERGRDHKEWPIDEELRNIELEKELEKRMRRRREGYNEKDTKYKDEVYAEKYRESSRHKEDKNRENGERVSKSRDLKHRVQSEKDLKHRDDDKYHEESKNDRDKHHKDGHRENRHKDEKHRDKNVKNLKDDKQTNRDRRRDNDKDEVIEKRSMSDDKVDPNLVNHNRHKSSPNGKYYPARDHHRGSKQEETKSRDYVNDERALNSNKDLTSAHGQSGNLEKTTQKDDNCINESQMDGDNLSVSSPFSRNVRYSSNHKYFHPHQTPIRTGSDGFSGFGSLEEDKSNSNNRNYNYPNMGRIQSNWNNIPNWSTPFPFPPIFNPIMQPFGPPIFGQPPMNMARFSGHGIPIPLHGYGRVDWEHNRIQSNNQMWGDAGVGVDIQSVAEDQKDEILSEESQPEEIENNEESQPETMNETPEVIMEVKKEDDGFISRVYLSKIDISEDLTQPDVYEECRKMLDLDQTSIHDEFDCKILFLEEGLEGDGASLFDAIDNSVFKKAMSLYTKQKEGGEGALMEEAIEDPSMEVIKKNEKPSIQKLDMDLSASNTMNMDIDMDAGVKDFGSCYNGGKAADGGGSLLVVMPESNEFGSVKLSRIHDHDSSESTH